ncbi:uncharacterized protein LOC144348601 [Saccoglossus kowalevskii]
MSAAQVDYRDRDREIETVMLRLGLGNLTQRFRDERIDIHTVPNLTDGQLIRLGVSKMGDQVRLREMVSEIVNKKDDIPSTSARRHGAAEIALERASLFSPSTSSSSGSSNARGQKRKRVQSSAARRRTWTSHLICLASRTSSRAPSVTERQVLHRAGLGSKKIQFLADDDEESVIQKISDESEGFPQLRNCGGFELMQCLPHCRELTLVSCRSWSVSELKAHMGSQAKIYIRPIQTTLSTEPIEQQAESSSLKEICRGCNQEVLVRELRDHLWTCSSVFDDSEDENITTMTLTNENIPLVSAVQEDVVINE